MRRRLLMKLPLATGVGPGAALRRRKAVWLAIALACATLGYALLLPGIGEDSAVERQFNASSGQAPQLAIYAEILHVDPGNQGLQLRLHFTPGRGLRGERPDSPGRDVVLRVEDGYDVQDLPFRAQAPMPPAVLQTSLNGSSAAAYPLEHLHATLRIALQDGLAPPDGASPRLLPVRLTLWEGVLGWTMRSAAEPAAGAAEQVRLQLGFRRSTALAVLVLALYGMMALIGAAALTIGGLVFLRLRKLEASLTSSLSGMLFALPAMRYALPGTPPLGVLADRAVFLWAELAVGLGLLLYVLTWALHGPRE